MLTFLPLLTVRGDDGLAKNISDVIFDSSDEGRREYMAHLHGGPIAPPCMHREADEIERNERLTTWVVLLLALAFLGLVFAALPECSDANERANVEVSR